MDINNLSNENWRKLWASKKRICIPSNKNGDEITIKKVIFLLNSMGGLEKIDKCHLWYIFLEQLEVELTHIAKCKRLEIINMFLYPLENFHNQEETSLITNLSASSINREIIDLTSDITCDTDANILNINPFKENNRLLPSFSNSSNKASISSSNIRQNKKSKDEEKRLKRWRSSMTNSISTRLERSYYHRIFLINRKEISNVCREFMVLGNTGNVYTVTISHLHHCTCPDFSKGNLCKHILFCLNRVLKVSSTNPLCWQNALLTSELHSIFSNAPIDPSLIACEKVRNIVAAKTEGKAPEMVERKTFVGEECTICFEPLDDKEELVWDQYTCGNSFHKRCIDMWATNSRNRNEPVTCPLCRGNWEDISIASSPSHGYLNLAEYSEIPILSYNESYPDTYFWGGYHKRRRYSYDDSEYDEEYDDFY